MEEQTLSESDELLHIYYTAKAKKKKKKKKKKKELSI